MNAVRSIALMILTVIPVFAHAELSPRQKVLMPSKDFMGRDQFIQCQVLSVSEDKATAKIIRLDQFTNPQILTVPCKSLKVSERDEAEKVKAAKKALEVAGLHEGKPTQAAPVNETTSAN